MSSTISEIDRGPLLENGDYMFDQDRLDRDLSLTQRVQSGYIPPLRDPNRTQPLRIIEGALEADAAVALGELWEHYRPMAIATANSKRGLVHAMPAVDVDDLINQTYFGVFHSALRWHPNKRITFATHCQNMMQNYIQEFIDQQSSAIRLPDSRRAEVRKMRATTWQVYQDDERMPRKERIAKAMGVSLDRVEELQKNEAMTRQMGSLDGGYFEDDRDEHSVYDVRENRWKPLDPEAHEAQALEDDYLIEQLGHDMRTLTNRAFDDRSLQILRMYFVDQMTYDEVGEVLNISRGRVGVLMGQILERLRDGYFNRKVYDYYKSKE